MTSLIMRNAIAGIMPTLLTWSFLATIAPCVADEPTRLRDDVRSILRSNAEVLDPTSVVYDMVRTTPLSLQSLSEKLQFQGPPSEFVKEQAVRYCWQGGMTFVRTRTTSFVRRSVGPVTLAEYGVHGRDRKDDQKVKARTSKNAPNEPRLKVVEIQETAIDLVNYYNGTGEETTAVMPGKEFSIVLGIEPLKITKSKLRGASLVRPEYFYEAGFLLPKTPEEQGQMQKSIVLARIEDLGDQLVAVEEKKIDDKIYLMVATRAKDKNYQFYLDPKLGYAVRRRVEQAIDGRLLVQSDCSDFDEFGKSGHWLPRHCRVTYHQWSTNAKLIDREPLVYVDFNVQELNHSPISPETFRLQYRKPGAYISDATIPGAEALPSKTIAYRIPADPSQLDSAIESGRRGEDRDKVFGRANRSRRRTLPLILIANIVLIAGLAVWMYRRYRHIGNIDRNGGMS
jgi:hypothetical protein